MVVSSSLSHLFSRKSKVSLSPSGVFLSATVIGALSLCFPLQAASKKSPVRDATKDATAEVITDSNGINSTDSVSALRRSGSASANAITININGRVVQSDPAPILRRGAVLVPLRGVLENLGATVDYVPADRRIEITQQGKKVTLRLGENTAVVDLQAVKLSAAPAQIGGSTFVPMRSLAEIFGYQVAWLLPVRTVSITSDAPPPLPVEHRPSLERAGAFGVAIDFTATNPDPTPEEVTALLDAAAKAGAGFIKMRFDWDVLEPVKGGAFQWPVYDRIVREARLRNIVVVGVLGNSARWASTLSSSSDPFVARNAPPRDKEIPAWQNFVKRTVGRYRQDVHAWQIWENPSPSKFRSTARNYRIVVRSGAEAARLSDPKAIVLASEPGGINLDFVDGLKRNGLTGQVDGLALYPSSQWQPGVPARPEDFLLPVATLRGRMAPLGLVSSDLWVGGLSRAVIEAADLSLSATPGADAGPMSAALDAATRERLIKEFTPQAQADYLMRASVLSLASGSGKVVWESLRDDGVYESVQPINPARGSGLLRRDNTPRPSFDAFAAMTKLLAGKNYAGALSLGPNAVGLVFTDKKTTHVAAWPLRGKLTIALNHENIDPKLPNSIFLPSLPSTKILDSTGKELFGDRGTFTVEDRPIWISDTGYEVPGLVKEKPGDGKAILVQFEPESSSAPDQENGVKAEFTAAPDKVAKSENGIEWRRFLAFRGAAPLVTTNDGRNALKAEFSRDIWNPANAKPFIYLDVEDDYLYFTRSVPARVTVEVHRAGPLGDPVSPSVAGFCIEYDSVDGPKRTVWQDIEEGTGWTTYSIDLPDASFANRGGFDLLINAWGSKQDVLFGSVSVQRLDRRDSPAPAVTPITTAAATPDVQAPIR